MPQCLNTRLLCVLQDLGVFIPPMAQGMRTDFFLEGPFMPRMKLDRETLGGLADMFGQMPGTSMTDSLE